MKLSFSNKHGDGQFIIQKNENKLCQIYFKPTGNSTLHTIAWNQGKSQTVTIDKVKYIFEPNTILPIMLNQSFYFENPQDIIAWQFNSDFYCIVNHDLEVGCVGFLFFGPNPNMFIKLNDDDLLELHNLLLMFEKEISANEEIKGEMLRILLVQLIIKITRLAKKQYMVNEIVSEAKFNLVRQFNLLVEIHFRTQHQVKFYASILHKSPKTISNYFALYYTKSPSQMITERIITEIKRLIYYTNKSDKEIANELGFKYVSHYYKYFKNATNNYPSELRRQVF